MSATLARLIGSAFGAAAAELPGPSLKQPLTTGRSRRKLWELPSRWLCPLIGTCLPVTELRKLATRAGFDAKGMSDYSLHSVAVGHCESRCELAELIQRHFDKRYAVAVRRFAAASDGAAVLFAWRAVLAQGEDVSGALWAVWTHPLLDEADGKEVFGDIHMLSHQMGASARADLGELHRLRGENAELRADMVRLRREQEASRQAQAASLARLQERLAQAEAGLLLLPQRERELTMARAALREYDTVLERAQALAARVERLEERNAANARRANQAEGDAAELRAELTAADAALALALQTPGCAGLGAGATTAGCGKTCPAEAALAGRCVLCIGGRSGLVDGYRKLVEHRGGRFVHHDGGMEESLHRLDAAVAAADAVVCQSGCVSHAAYWRLKDACKKLGKPCVFVQSPGVTSFARGLAVLGGETPAGAQVTLLAH